MQFNHFCTRIFVRMFLAAPFCKLPRLPINLNSSGVYSITLHKSSEIPTEHWPLSNHINRIRCNSTAYHRNSAVQNSIRISLLHLQQADRRGVVPLDTHAHTPRNTRFRHPDPCLSWNKVHLSIFLLQQSNKDSKLPYESWQPCVNRTGTPACSNVSCGRTEEDLVK